jgi:hypothetical protein
MSRFQDAAHFVRLAVLIGIGLLVFLVFRSWAVPAGFGQYGHYRGPALNELRAKPVVFAGREVCQTCHTDQFDKVAAGPHATVHCEACHGPQANHAENIEPKPVLPKTPALCVQCHEAGTGGNPKNFKRVNSAEHSGGVDCKSCHQPHNPKEGL